VISQDVKRARRGAGLLPSKGESGPALRLWLSIVLVLALLFLLGGKHLL
jgi:hypothetical protein